MTIISKAVTDVYYSLVTTSNRNYLIKCVNYNEKGTLIILQSALTHSITDPGFSALWAFTAPQ